MSFSTVAPAPGNKVKLLVANVPPISITPTIAPLTGDTGSVTLNAPAVVLALTKSYASAVYVAVLAAVTFSPAFKVAHDALVPSVVKNFPLLLVCVGNVIGGDDDTQVVPLLVSKLPEVPGATACSAEVPLPNNTLLAVNVVAPVPPFATLNAVDNVSEVADATPKIGVINVGLVA